MLQNKFYYFFSIFILLLSSCSTLSTNSPEEADQSLERFRIDSNQKEVVTYCSQDDLQRGVISKFKLGDIICAKYILNHRTGYKLKINYKTLNKNSNDSYKRGYWELQVFYKNELVKTINIRKSDDPAWFDVSFVRIRNKKYFADINSDGFDDFAIFPYSPGSASFGSLRIFSLKKNISRLGVAKYHIEGDGHALFNCPQCSKFDFQECRKCR